MAVDTDEAVTEAFRLYCDMAGPLGLTVPKVFHAKHPRWGKLKARLRDAGGLDGWIAALEKVKGSTFLRGAGGRDTWKGADLDFLLQPSRFTRVLEGAYDDNARAPSRDFDQRRRTVREGVAQALGLCPADGGGVDEPDLL